MEREKTEQEKIDIMIKRHQALEIQRRLKEVKRASIRRIRSIEKTYHKRMVKVSRERNDKILLIPNFWLNAFLSHPILDYRLNPTDIEIFKHLRSIKVRYHRVAEHGCRGYTITFSFGVNDYFSNKQLKKLLVLRGDEPIRVEATPINWTNGTGVPNEFLEQQGLDQNNRLFSFFNWFYQTAAKEDLGIDDEFAALIKDDIVIDPFKYLRNGPAEAN